MDEILMSTATKNLKSKLAHILGKPLESSEDVAGSLQVVMESQNTLRSTEEMVSLRSAVCGIRSFIVNKLKEEGTTMDNEPLTAARDVLKRLIEDPSIPESGEVQVETLNYQMLMKAIDIVIARIHRIAEVDK